MERGLIDMDQMLSLVFRIWLPIHEEPESISPVVADLLAEYDQLDPDIVETLPLESIPDNFESRCREAFREHLKRYPVPEGLPLATASHCSPC